MNKFQIKKNMKKLFLTSEGKHPNSIKELEKFVGGFKGKKIIYIPTAGNGEFWGAWKTSKSINIVKSLVADFEVIQLEDYYSYDVIEKISSADILWIAGGMSAYLLYWIRRVKLDKALPEFLDQGMIYVGSSAGSMICSKTQESSEWFIDEPEPGASLIPGLGFIDFEIYPHYEEKLKPQIEKLWKKGKLCLLKDGEIVTVEDNQISIIGEERFIEK